MNGFVDIHHHLLYGLDDGPAAFDQMAGMLRAACADGISAIIATPHASPGVRPFDGALMERRLNEAREYCRENGLDLTIYPGAEVLYTPMLLNIVSGGNIPTLAGTRYVLVEFAPSAGLDAVESAARALVRSGRVPIFAHVERCRFLTARPERMRLLKAQYGVLFQVNCAALLEGGWLSMGRLLREGLIDFAATNAHDTIVRDCRMSNAYRRLERTAGSDCAKALTGGNAMARFFA
jgi:protein-tyrosine phosphatase